MARTPLMQRLLTLTKIAHQSNKKNIPAEEYAEQNFYNRRNFLSSSVKAAAAITVLAGCSKIAEQPARVDAFSEDDSKSTDPKIVIIGAGIAGLSAAFNLKVGGLNADLYDANTRAGGRMFTAQNILNPGLSTELGGEFIDTGHYDIRAYAKYYGLKLIDVYSPSELELQQNIYYINGVSYSDEDFMRDIKPYLWRINKDVNSLTDFISYYSFSPTDKKFDDMNLEQYFDSINLTGWLRSLLTVAYVGEYGLEADECDAINFLYLFGVSPEGSVALYGVSDERYKVLGGNQQIVDALANQFKNKIHLQHNLAKIKSTNAGGYELFFEGKPASVKADIVILTLPFTLLREVEIDVDLPNVKRKAINTLSYGTNSKLLLGFTGRPWRTKYNSVGMSYSDNGTENTWDNSQLQPGNNGGLTVYFGGKDGITVGQGSVNSKADKYLNLLNQIYPGIKNNFNNKAYRMVWPTFPFTKASYSAWSVGQYTTIAGSEIETVGNLYFAGEHTSYNFQGYMNGGAVTGRIAARNILRAMNKENSIAPPIAFNHN